MVVSRCLWQVTLSIFTTFWPNLKILCVWSVPFIDQLKLQTGITITYSTITVIQIVCCLCVRKLRERLSAVYSIVLPWFYLGSCSYLLIMLIYKEYSFCPKKCDIYFVFSLGTSSISIEILQCQENDMQILHSFAVWLFNVHRPVFYITMGVSMISML